MRFGIVCTLLFLFVGCRGGKPSELQESDFPSLAVGATHSNVLLITIDTLRADHLGAYGYFLPTSPSIDALAKEGVVFTEAFTPVPTTAPALASLVTSVHVDQHRVRGNLQVLPDELITLGEVFAEAGYDTGAFYGNNAIRDGFGQGFRTFERFSPKRICRDEVGTDKAIKWLETAKSPWFLWIHFMDPHGPYKSSPAELSVNFTYPSTKQMRHILKLGKKNYGFGVLPKYQQIDGQRRVVDYIRRYDGEIVGTDLEVGKLRDALEERGLLKHTLIVLSADHGESLGEDAYYFQHGSVLNRASLRIPLLFRHPDLPAGRRIEAPVSLLDVFPTVAALLDLPRPDQLLGEDLRSLMAGEPSQERTFLSYSVTSEMATSIRCGRWELRGRPRAKSVPGDVLVQMDLYDWSLLPPKKMGADRHPKVRARFEPLLRAAARRVRANRTAQEPLSEEDREHLRSLGYLDWTNPFSFSATACRVSNSSKQAKTFDSLLAYRDLTSSRSRSPSPSAFRPSTENNIASPGNTVRCGAIKRNDRPSLIIEPHDGVGGWTPRPRKLRLASATIAPARPKVACTTMGAAMSGRMWRRRIVNGPRPRDFAASTCSRVLTPRTSARTRRA